jgi:hypothetical protein
LSLEASELEVHETDVGEGAGVDKEEKSPRSSGQGAIRGKHKIVGIAVELRQKPRT